MLKNSQETYGSVSKSFHWIIALLIFAMLILGFVMVGQKIVTIHQFTGLAILILVFCRLVWTFTNQHPLLPSKMPLSEKMLARVVQVLLYVCMFGMPLSGWAMSTAFGFTPHIAHIRVPMPGIPIDQQWGSIFETIHNTMAFILIGLIGLHLIGALKHYFIDKDTVMQSMVPGLKKRNK